MKDSKVGALTGQYGHFSTAVDHSPVAVVTEAAPCGISIETAVDYSPVAVVTEAAPCGISIETAVDHSPVAVVTEAAPCGNQHRDGC